MPLSKAQVRARVVEEICKTEQDYIQGINLVLEHYHGRMHDNPDIPAASFTTLFSNIAEIGSFQKQFKHDLYRAWLGDGGCIEDCFVAHKDGFKIYSEYCNNHARSVQELYTLLEKPNVRALIKACQLRSGADLSLEAYLLAPIQRICKYPLLLKELLKRSEEEEEVASAKRGLDAMKEVAEAVNEDKRRMEDLESIDAWQGQVDGWTGPNLRDTSRQLIFKSPVTKYSLSKNKATSNDRWFFLFDNVLIYCKKNTSFVRTSMKRRGSSASDVPTASYTFKGRIPTKNLTVLALEDDKAHAQTNGVTVSNALKISNDAKNKWYILSCKTPELKAEWLEHFAAEKGRLEKTQDGRIASWEQSLDKEADTLHSALLNQNISGQPFIRDRKQRMVSYKSCFEGRELVTFLKATEWCGIRDSDAAMLYCQSLVDGGILHHVTDKYAFENDSSFYRFRCDDGTFKDKNIVRGLEKLGIQVYRRLHGLESCSVISDRTHHMKTFKNAFVGSELVDWLIEQGDVNNREEGEVFGQGLLNLGFIHHVTDEHVFKDKHLFYRWTTDDEISKKSVAKKNLFRVYEQEDHTVHEYSVERGEEGFGFILAGEYPARIRSVDADSPAEAVGITPGHYVLTVNGEDATGLLHSQVVGAIKTGGTTVVLGLQAAEDYRRDNMYESETNPPGLREREVVCYTYVSRENRKLQVTESLRESPLGFALPCAMLSLCMAEDNRRLQVLTNLDIESTRVMASVAKTILMLRRRVHHYEDLLAHLNELARKGVCFKKSTDKTVSELSFVPTNCHIQKVTVVGDHEHASSHLWVTGGAPAAQALGFSNGCLNVFSTTRPDTYPALKALELDFRRITLVDAGIQNIHSEDAVCRTAFTGAEDGDISSLSTGDKLKVIRRNGRSGHAVVKNLTNGQEGIVPLTHIEHDESLDDAQCAELMIGASALEKLAYRVKGHMNDRAFNPPLPNEYHCDLEMCLAELSSIAIEDLIMNADTLRAVSQRLLGCVNALVEEVSRLVYVTDALMDDLSCTLRGIDAPEKQEPYGLRYRHDIVMSQAITMLTTGLVSRLREEVRQLLNAKAGKKAVYSEWLEGLCSMGVLAHFESLVSTCDDDRGMLADFWHATEELCNVNFQFSRQTRRSSYYDVSVSGSRDKLVVIVQVDQNTFDLLPSPIQGGQHVPVTAVLFSQGVNETQTMANRLNASDLQDEVNCHSTERLLAFARTYRGQLLDTVASSSVGAFVDKEGLCLREARLERLQRQLLTALPFTSEKNLNVLTLSAEMARAMNGLRFTSCKSGKDRTAMSITLEQAELLVRKHGLPPGHFRAATQLMRSDGVRKLNCYKNIGKMKYAFDDDQCQNHLPGSFVPPLEVIGAHTT